MRYNNKSSSALLIRHSLIMIIIFLSLTHSSSITAQTEFDYLRKDVSYPGQIPDFHDYSTPSIVPGTSGTLKFQMWNRYDFDPDNTMYNVTLLVNIYYYSTLEKSRTIQRISNAPKIARTGGNADSRTISDKWTAQFFWLSIPENDTVDISLKIKSSPATPEGRYFVRMHLSFVFRNESFNMKSRGYFTDSLWEQASMNISDQSGLVPVNGDWRLYAGRLDLDKLEVDGIVPDTSFRVLTPIPTWPLYVCLIPPIILCLILAVVFYMMDEKGKFPNTKKKLDGWWKKVEDFRYRRSK